MANDATERFGNRAGDYAKARPSYPREVFEFLTRDFRLQPGESAADLGSGTGISAGLLLDRGLKVFAVEPNAGMRAKAEEQFGACAGFFSVNGRAEATTLLDASVDWAFAAQAFHWFDADAVANEVRRILKPRGRCALLWNERQSDTTPFARAYEDFLIEWGNDYLQVKATYENAANIAKVLGANYTRASFPHAQEMDRDLFRTRTQSASYVPKSDTERGAAMMHALDALFDQYHESGKVRFDYLTNVYCARIK